MPTQTIACPMCGSSESAHAERCLACGAKLHVDLQDDADDAAIDFDASFSWKWASIAFGVLAALQLLVLALLPRVYQSFDPQGLPGLLLIDLLCLLGGLGIGLVAPAKSFVEPAFGALFVVPGAIAYLAVVTPAGFQPSLIAYAFSGLLGVMAALLGAIIADQLQRATTSKPRTSAA